MTALFALVMVAIAVESVVGFGATVLTLSLGVWLLPVTVLLPAYIPANVALSAFIAWRDRALVDRALILKRVLPLAGAGLLVGFWLYRYAARPELQRAFGVMVVLIGLNELRRVLWPPKGPGAGAALANVLLVTGGVVHGIFGVGGVVIVAALARERLEKSTLRATAAALWLLMNSAMVANYALHGDFGAASMRRTAVLLPAVLIGGWVGNAVHRRVAERPFRVAVALVMTAAGVAALLKR